MEITGCFIPYATEQRQVGFLCNGATSQLFSSQLCLFISSTSVPKRGFPYFVCVECTCTLYRSINSELPSACAPTILLFYSTLKTKFFTVQLFKKRYKSHFFVPTKLQQHPYEFVKISMYTRYWLIDLFLYNQSFITIILGNAP